MALRNRLPDDVAGYPDPELGVNLRAAEQDLKPGEARLMQNCVFDGGTRMRLGSGNINTSSLGSFKIRGGHKFYYGSASSKRLIAYSTKISVMSDGGTETVLTSGMTSDQDTHFSTWSITDKDYISNGTDELKEYDGSTFQNVSAIGGATNVPGNGGNAAAIMIAPVLDRLLAVTSNGIERSNPRQGHIWSSNSSWATLRPSLVGRFTAIAPHTVETNAELFPGAIAFQANAHYLVTGTNYGSDVTAGTASTGEDASIKLLDSRVGSGSPYSICSVPGIGLFWFTSDLNVYWLPYGRTTGQYVGDKLKSNSSTLGIESTNKAALNQVTMVYFDRYLRLAIPTGSAVYPSREFWMDMRSLVEHPDRGPVWYGPMTGRTVGRQWAETQGTDDALYGGEGNSATGAFVYELDKASTYTDAVGTSDTDIDMEYRTFFNDAGEPSKQKYVRAVHFDLQSYTGTATVDLYDLSGLVDSTLPVQRAAEV